MTTPAAATAHKVPFGHKVAFGLGMLANQMFPAALGIFMVVLVQNLGFPPWMWGILFFLPRIFDSVTDPIMGFISDNTRSKWGRRKQYVFIGAIVMGISFVAMWQLHRDDGVNYNFYYFLWWSIVFYAGLTLFSIPYVAMGYEMSDDFHERTSIMAVAQWIGQWAWVIAPWFWVVMYDPSWFENADTATRTLSVWVGVVCMLLAMVPALFLPSRATQDDTHLVPLTWANFGGGMKEILRGFVEAFGSVPFRKLCFATFLIFNAFNTVAAFSFFIVVYHLFNGDTAAAGIWPTLFGSIGALVTTFAVIPTVAWMSKKMGKKNAFMLSQGISLIGYVLLWFLMIPGKPWMFMFALPFFSFGIGGLFTLMMSMTADVCDLDELATGKRREGIFGAIYWWMVKFGFAIAGLLSGAIMAAVAFTPGAALQPDGAVDGLRLFYSGVPIFGTLLAMWVMRDYDLDEKRANEVHAELERRRQRASGSSSQGSGARPWLAQHGLLLPGAEPSPLAGKPADEIRALYAEQLERGLYGLSFSAYAEGQRAGDQLLGVQRQPAHRRHRAAHALGALVRVHRRSRGHSPAGPRQGPEDDGGGLDQPRPRAQRTGDPGPDHAGAGRHGRHGGGGQRGAAARGTDRAGTARLHPAREGGGARGRAGRLRGCLLPVPGAAGTRRRLRRAAAQLLPVLGRCRHRPRRAVPAAHGRPGEGRRRRKARRRRRDRLARQGSVGGRGRAVGRQRDEVLHRRAALGPGRGGQAVLLLVLRRALEAGAGG
jgi:glycoside/pentoside/hexuronide:cation symporter, GPH family